ncbi:ABC transporter substrate-binding protein [Thalassospiraceae bacterium LMO-JJ14]|nr:ABC transporter substrate-binding protein [Thalassospiraceae bacterium LMO-JJ14]
MRLKLLTKALAVAAVAMPLTAAVADAYELVIPATVYRTGPYAPNGIPFANGYGDYYKMLNERDGGIEGVKIKYLECETAYNTKQGVECYENTKATPPSGALAYQPLSTGITYQLIPKATEDKIPVFSMGYGRTSAANGKVFPYIFNFPATYWDQASVFVKYIGEKEGGMDKLKGKKIALVYHNSAYGKEPIRTLEELSKKHGFELQLLAVDHPGQEQKATWLQVRRERPDWVLMWGWGVMNQVAVKEAASIRFPMDHFIGVWWSGSENDVLPAGASANGYLSGAFHAAGDNYRAHDDIKKFVYDKGMGGGDRDRIGEVLYNRGLVAAMWTSEAIRTAMRIHNTKEPTSEQVRDGFEALNVDAKRLAVLGLEGFTYPVKISCENHQGPGKVALQQWDAKAKKWSFVSDFYEPDHDVVNALIAEDSANFAKENNITPRTCN